jgi:hypothetical protein
MRRDRARNVDQIDVLVTRAYVFELDAEWLSEACRFSRCDDVAIRQPYRAIDECNAQAALLERLTYRRFVWQLALVDVSAGRQPHAEPLVAVQKDAPVVDDEDRDGELADGCSRGCEKARAG